MIELRKLIAEKEKQRPKKLPEVQQRVIEYLESYKGPSLNAVQIGKKLGLDRRSITKAIDELISIGILSFKSKINYVKLGFHVVEADVRILEGDEKKIINRLQNGKTPIIQMKRLFENRFRMQFVVTEVEHFSKIVQEFRNRGLDVSNAVIIAEEL